MGTVMKASEFVAKLKDVANNHKTLYVMGCFGAPMTSPNKDKYIKHHSYNQQASRKACINAATSDTFGFDCVCLIKGILWGWDGNKTKLYGGAKYASNGVPDIGADYMIKECSGLSTDFSKIEVGEAVWCKGHIGVYIGNGLAIECTPAWKNRVQITAVKNIGTKSGYNARTWTKHGKLPYIEYDVKSEKAPVKQEKKVAKPATNFDKNLAGSYKVTASALHIRTEPNSGSAKTSMGTLSKNAVVRNYGYYSLSSSGAKWLSVETDKGLVGFCSAKYLKKQ